MLNKALSVDSFTVGGRAVGGSGFSQPLRM